MKSNTIETSIINVIILVCVLVNVMYIVNKIDRTKILRPTWSMLSAMVNKNIS